MNDCLSLLEYQKNYKFSKNIEKTPFRKGAQKRYNFSPGAASPRGLYILCALSRFYMSLNVKTQLYKIEVLVWGIKVSYFIQLILSHIGIYICSSAANIETRSSIRIYICSSAANIETRSSIKGHQTLTTHWYFFYNFFLNTLFNSKTNKKL